MSSLIEGIGDEVLVAFAVLLLAVLISLAWLSTHVGDAPPLSIIILDRQRWNQVLQRLRNTSATIIRIPIRRHTHTQQAEQPTTDPLTLQTDTNIEPVTVSQPSEHTQQAEQPTTDPPIQQTDTVTEPATVSQPSEQQPQYVHTDSSTPQGSSTDQTECGPETAKSDSPSPATAASDEPPASVADSHDTGPSDQFTEEEWQERSSEGFIRVKVKYLDDRQRMLYAKPDTTIGQLKRVHFQREMSDNMAVRIVYQGQELRTEAATLQGCNITDNSVIHIVLTRARETPQPPLGAQRRSHPLDPGQLMMPLFAVLLAGVWYCCLVYRAYFSILATICLGGITFLFGLVCYATLTVHRYPAPRGGQHLD